MSSYYFNDFKIGAILLVGFGTTGKAVYEFLNKFADLKIDIYSSEQRFLNYDLYKYDLIVLSPGIPINKYPYDQLKNYKNKLVCDIDIFCHKIRNKLIKTIAVTGSNGKSTVVTLLNYILNQLGHKSILTGNIGVSPLTKLENDFEFCIIELSSFQIDLLQIAKFTIGCVINIFPDHLDRYASLVEYKQSKLSLEKFSKKFITYDVDGRGLKYGGKYKIINNNIYKNSTKLLGILETNLFGLHNLENIVVVFNILDKLNIDIGQTIDIIKTFNGLNHRCKLVAKVNGISYVNDSKGTNVAATIAALKSVSNIKNTILLLGGIAKENDFFLMKEYLIKLAKFVIIYGKDRECIRNQIGSYCKYYLCNSMRQGFRLAHQKAQMNDIVLLSPACASFDEFSDYVERGHLFENLVLQIINN